MSIGSRAKHTLRGHVYRLSSIVYVVLLLAWPLSAQSADLVLRHTTVYTVDAAHPTAQAVAVRAGKIVYVGDDAGVQRFIGAATRTLDLHGRFVYPGFVDAHAHFPGIGEREMTLNLEGTRTKGAFLARVAAAVQGKKPGEWVTGRGWIETFWTPQVFPTRQDLDRIAPHNPVWLTRADGHASVANSAALRLAKITAATTSPPGGHINLDRDGQPTGMLIDNAESLVYQLLPQPTETELDSAYMLASQRELSLGWTQVQDAHGSWGQVERMRRLISNGKIRIRLYKTIDGPGPGADRLIAQGPGPVELDDHLQVRDIKIVMDGALGSRGAALLEPYTDDPTTRGLITTDTIALKEMLPRALRAGVQVETHAIGDRANRIILDLYAAAMQAVPPAERKIPNPRWRVEHAQIVSPQDLPRFKQLGIIASMQPSHAIGDLFFAESRLGLARLKGAYAWQTFLTMGVPVPGGSDAPVERGEPMIEFYAAVARKALDGRSGPDNVWHPEEKVTRAQALKMFTWFPAYAAFEEDRHGSLVVGKAADFTVLDQDIMTIPEARIPATRNVMTIVGGEVVYRKN
ncbi:MAG: amidohydrolase [Gemmatimonadales bacterium]